MVGIDQTTSAVSACRRRRARPAPVRSVRLERARRIRRAAAVRSSTLRPGGRRASPSGSDRDPDDLEARLGQAVELATQGVELAVGGDQFGRCARSSADRKRTTSSWVLAPSVMSPVPPTRAKPSLHSLGLANARSHFCRPVRRRPARRLLWLRSPRPARPGVSDRSAAGARRHGSANSAPRGSKFRPYRPQVGK